MLVVILVAAGVGLTAPASAEPELVLPREVAEPPPELAPPPEPRAPSPETVRAREALADALRAPEGIGTVTVTPSTGLVHDQEVTVRGTGMTPGHEVTAFQCGPAPLEQGDCEPTVIWDERFPRVGPGGNVATTFRAEVILDNPRDPVDCRLVTCRIALLDLWTSRARFVDVTFDPGGPDPTRIPVTVTPNTGLLDGDVLTVTATDIPTPDDFLELAVLSFCRLPVISRADCDGHQVEYRELEGGDLDATTWASAILDLPSGDHDCRVGPCAVIVGPENFGFGWLAETSEAGLAEIEFDPGGALRPPPTLTVDPDTDLNDGDAVRLHGTGFDHERGVTINQCAATATSDRDCVGGISRFSWADDAGEFRGYLGVLAKFVDGRGRTIDCRVEDCVVVVAHGDLGRHARAALDFDPDAPLLDPTITVTPSTGLEDGDEVTVTGTNWPHDQPILLTQCPYGEHDFYACDFLDGGGFAWPRSVTLPVARTRADAESSTGFRAEMRVRTRIWTERGRLDCRVDRCAVLASDDTGMRQAQAPISFAEAAEGVGPISASPSFTG